MNTKISIAMVTTWAALTLGSIQAAQPATNPPGSPAAPSPTEPPVQLDPFTINTSTEDGYISRSTAAFGRVVMRLEDIPQKIDIFNAEFISDIVPTSLTDITRYSTAVNYNNAERNNNGTSLIRGFNAAIRRNGENLGDLPGLVGIEAIEQVEVVKGPSAVLYGASQPGGVLNYVTKIPKFKRETTLTGQLHSFGGYTAGLDTTGPIGSAARKGGPIAAYRVVLVTEDRDEYQDNNDYFERQVLFGKLLVRPAPWVSFTLEAEKNDLEAGFFNSQLPLQSEYNASRAAPYSTTVPNPALVGEPFYLPISWSYQTDDTYRSDSAEIFQGTVTLEKDFARFGRWTLRSFYSMVQSNTDRYLVDVGNTAYPRPVAAVDLGKVVNRDQQVTAADVSAGRLWIPQRSLRLINDVSARSARNQIDLTGNFDTGPVKHTFLAGTELSLGSKTRFAPYSEGRPGGTTRFAQEGVAGNAFAMWVDSPDYRAIPVDWNDVRGTSNPNGTVRLQLPAAGVPQDNLRFEIPFITEEPDSYYFFDALSMFEGQLQVSFGLRHDDIRQEYRDAAGQVQAATSSQWTKRIGAVYKIRPWIHVYGLYNESFSPNPAGALNAWQTALAPQDGEQIEGGVRLNLFSDRLSIDASYFEITNKNVYQNDPFGNLPTRFPPGTDLTTIPTTVLWPNTPGLENVGFDIEAKFRLSSETQFIASYTHNDMKATGTVTQQLALGSTTYPVSNVPDHQFAVWSKWTPTTTALRGFSFNLGYRYIGQRLGGPIGNVGQIELSAYGIVDAGVAYRYKRWYANLIVRNVLDEYAFRTASGSDRLYPEKPLHAILTIETKL